MLTILLLALAYGSPNMSFPWWVWVLSVFFSGVDISINYPKHHKE